MSGELPHGATPSESSPSNRVIRLVAASENVEPVDLPPLIKTIDPDALDSLFAGKNAISGKVVFQYHGYCVTVEDGDEISLDVV